MANNHILPRLATVLSVDANGTPVLFRQIQPLSASVGSNALTVTLGSTLLEFRSTVLASGTPNVRVVPSAISLTVPAGATLGTQSGVPARLIVVAIDNAGTVELAVVNLAGDVTLDETALITTGTITTSANAASVFYSATSRGSVPFRVVGFIDIAQGTAGQWASSPILVQGTGGQSSSGLIDPRQSGQVAFFARQTPPPGWLKANGAAVSRTAYTNLFTAISTLWGGGDGSTTFNVPDLRGEFLRGWDDGRGADPGRGVATWQGSQNLIHSHGASAFVSDPGHAHITQIPVKPNGTGAGPYAMLDGFNGITGYQGTATDTRATGITVSVSVANDGGGEARPRNIALLACIKY